MKFILTCLSLLVVDGDKLRCNDTLVRLWGIEAPAVSGPAGERARSALVELTKGKRVTCEPEREDSAGRTLARCSAGGVDLACSMVNAGHARSTVDAYARCARRGD